MARRTRPLLHRPIAWLTSVLLAGGLLVAIAAPASAATTRAFTPVYTGNTAGDILVRGNTMLTCPAGSTSQPGTLTCAQTQAGGSGQNNNFGMTYVDVDSDSTTFDSSSANISLPNGATVLFAALSWAGLTSAGSSGTYPSLNGVAAPNAALKGNVEFQAPGQAYAAITSSQTDANGATYQGYANVTSAVAAAGSGVYTVANVQAGTGANGYAGWSLAVAYRDPAQPTRNLVVYTGYNDVANSSTNVSIPVSGFTTPTSGPVVTRVGVVAYEGDRGATGETMSLGTTAMSNTLNPANDVFNSSITDLNTAVTDRTPNYNNTLGIDIDRFDETGVLANGATTATINLTTTGDGYFPGLLTFATNLYSPTLSATKTATDVNGGILAPGDLLSYSVAVTNTGEDGSTASVLTDSAPAGTTYVPGSLTIGGVAMTDATGDDAGDVAGGNVTARLGAGATAGAGGTMAVNAAITVAFQVRVNSADADATAISNQAALSYTGQTSGIALIGSSNLVTSTVVVTPTLTFAAPPAGQVGIAYSDQLTRSGGTGPFVWSISAGALPAGLSIDSASGLVSGTPTTAGSPSFTVKVVDANGHSDTRATSLTVVAAVALANPAPGGGEVGVAYSDQLSASGGTTPYVWSLASGSSLPAGLTLNSSTGLISGTPSASGTGSFTVQATDAQSQTATQVLTLSVAARPSLVFAPGTGTVGTAYSAQPGLTGGTGPFTWSVSAGTLPAGLSINTATGLISGTPTAAGSAALTVRVVDSLGASATADGTISVQDSGAVTLASSTSSITAGGSVTLTATVTPNSPTGTVTFTDTDASGPALGTVTVLGTSTVGSDGTASLTTTLAALGGHGITAAYSGDAGHSAATSAPTVVQVHSTVGDLIVREFRLSGPGGAGDQYVELYNASTAPITLAGFKIAASSGAVVTLPAASPSLPVGRSYLVAGPSYSLGSGRDSDYSGGSMGSGGIRVVSPDTVGTVTDAVGPNIAGYFTGTPLATMTGSPTDQFAWVRIGTPGYPKNTSDNALDFALVSATGGSIGGVPSMIGSPSPVGFTDAYQKTTVLTSALLDPSQLSTAAPNRVVVAGTGGHPTTLTVRRVITNTTSSTMSVVKLKLISLSEANGLSQSGVPGLGGTHAELRAIDPATATTAVVVAGTTVTVQNVRLDAPAVASLGGGLNTTFTVPVNGGLAPGASVAVALTFAADVGGTFWFVYDVDGLPAS